MGPGTRGYEIFSQMSDRLMKCKTDEERMAVVQWAQDVTARLVAWSTEVRHHNPHGGLTPDAVTGGYAMDRLRRVCAKCNGSRTAPKSPDYQHRCPPVLPGDFYWLSYGVEARDPTQPEWLNVEWFCRFVMSCGSIRMQSSWFSGRRERWRRAR